MSVLQSSAMKGFELLEMIKYQENKGENEKWNL